MPRPLGRSRRAGGHGQSGVLRQIRITSLGHPRQIEKDASGEIGSGIGIGKNVPVDSAHGGLRPMLPKRR